jgi:hypothetical protein
MRDALLLSFHVSSDPLSELTTETLTLPYSLPSIGPLAAAKGAVASIAVAVPKRITLFIIFPRKQLN